LLCLFSLEANLSRVQAAHHGPILPSTSSSLPPALDEGVNLNLVNGRDGSNGNDIDALTGTQTLLQGVTGEEYTTLSFFSKVRILQHSVHSNASVFVKNE
jgi:hypothetical protein